MRIFASILVMFILVLVATPCPDAKDTSLHKIENTSRTSEDHQNDVGHCSPFCTCNCCATPVIYQPCFIDLNCLEFTKKDYANYYIAFVSLIYNSIWQPPKLI